MNECSKYVQNAAHRADNDRFTLAERFCWNETKALTQELLDDQLALQLIWSSSHSHFDKNYDGTRGNLKGVCDRVSGMAIAQNVARRLGGRVDHFMPRGRKSPPQIKRHRPLRSIDQDRQVVVANCFSTQRECERL